MHQDDINKARSLVQQSQILSSVEKTEWLQLLPLMNNQQVAELIKILEDPHSADTQKLNPIRTLPNAAKPDRSAFDQKNKFKLPDIMEKELATSIPANELKLPVHATAAANTASISHKLVPVTSVNKDAVKEVKKEASPADIAKIIEHLKTPQTGAKDLANHSIPNSVQPHAHIPVPIPPVSMQAAKPESKNAPMPAPMPAHLSAHLPVQQKKAVEFKLNGPGDLQKISSSILHGKDPYVVFGKIIDFIVDSSKNGNTISMIESLQQSPLHKIYVQTGLSLLNDSGADREAVYKNIAEQAKQNGLDYMTKDEFEAYVDFRKELDKIYVI